MRLPPLRKYPKELHVNEETYSVRFVDKIPGEKLDVHGICDSGKHEILIRKDLTKSQTFRVFIHEVLHALEFEYEIKIEHKTVHQLEKAIGDLFIANF